MKFFLVFIGSGIGGVLRYGISQAFITSNTGKFPWATFIANIIASFLIGIFFAIATQKQWLDKSYMILLTAGICGGLSTFSTFSLETLRLWNGHQYLLGIFYIAISITTCLLFTYMGTRLVQ